MKLGNTDRVITIAFQKKADKPGMEDLKAFSKEDLQETLALYPDAQFVRWPKSTLWVWRCTERRKTSRPRSDFLSWIRVMGITVCRSLFRPEMTYNFQCMKISSIASA
jgi:hypothetical protein